MRKAVVMYPRYARSERIADGTLHAIGLAAALVGAIFLTLWAIPHSPDVQPTALIIYGAALLSTFAASAFYHMTPWEHLRPTLRRIDHAAIYLKIAGTYTPLVAMIGSALSYGLLALVWALAVYGMIRKLFYWQTPGRFGPALYLIMGWMGALLIWQALPILPLWSCALIAAGGGLYTIGVIFFAWDSLKFSLAIWHGFVLTASACLFAAILLGAMAQI